MRLELALIVFAEIVYEITLHPRPASRGFTGAVETDQPRGLLSKEPLSLCGFINSDAAWLPSISDYNVPATKAIPVLSPCWRRVAA